MRRRVWRLHICRLLRIERAFPSRDHGRSDRIANDVGRGAAHVEEVVDREDEKQADDMGLQLMAAANYNPNGMLDMFRKLLAQENGKPNAVDRFFIDHPLTQDRINDISNRIAKMGATGGTIDSPEYQSARASVR